MKYCNVLDKEDIKKKTTEALRRAKDTNREQGFNLCSSNGKTVATHVEGGQKDSVGMDNSCPRGAKIMGAFHVHTRPSLSKDAIPSPNDIKKGVVENMDFFCIGTNIDSQGIVRCFGKEDLESEMINIITKDKFKKSGMELEDIERSTRLITGRMSIDKDYLNTRSCQRIFT